MSLQDKVYIVTGSSSGIGRATALEICRQGGRVTLHGRDASKLQGVADECSSLNQIEPPQIVGDVTDLEIQKRLVNETIIRYEKLDCLVNNAGNSSSYGGIDGTSLEDLRSTLEVHCVAPFSLAKLATPHLVKSQGSIVNVSSVLGQAASNVVISYSAAKGALDSLTRALAVDLGPKGVRVNSVNPGVIQDTDIGRVSRTAFDAFWMTPDRYPLNRVGKSEEIAKAIIHLSTATFTTGENYRVDGGLLAGCYWATNM
ncbi:17-beta-hydroxysteroid dehydrogenase 14 [Galendromus occidentalis]|uniref:17-beta-hydroxysteroid dehydrogenase 14 n=1 Tax=Galendromus occidentalis TaxID=34638 RepID=A0AAJ6VVX9_9ACAR|nr:17-beta-hydroxysteroid dehydrogenase 14 [Galendromus occidentalis]